MFYLTTSIISRSNSITPNIMSSSLPHSCENGNTPNGDVWIHVYVCVIFMYIYGLYDVSVFMCNLCAHVAVSAVLGCLYLVRIHMILFMQWSVVYVSFVYVWNCLCGIWVFVCDAYSYVIVRGICKCLCITQKMNTILYDCMHYMWLLMIVL